MEGDDTTREPKRPWKGWLIAAAGLVAAAATVAGNIDKMLDAGAKWLGPYVSKYVNPRAAINIALDDGLTIAPHVFVADPANKTRAIAVADAAQGTAAILSVTADTFYRIGWQGAGLQAGGTDDVLATAGTSSFRLIRDGEVDGQLKLKLRQSDARGTAVPTAEPSAKLLLSARAAAAVTDPALPVASGALPELDRAVAVIGLFEVGTTDCARRLFFVAGTPAVGCLGASVPGWLADVIGAVDNADNADAHRLDALLGANAEPLRAYIRAPHSLAPDAPLREAVARLLSAPEFWIQYQLRVLAAYARATDTARELGLDSERGRLLVFDALVEGGPGYLTRMTARYAASHADAATGQSLGENERIQAVGEIFKAVSPTRSPVWARRIDTIVGGHGSIRGIAFDLDQLGISATGADAPQSAPPH